jgi:glycosyltransferase involved in cell wall biosynthesis
VLNILHVTTFLNGGAGKALVDIVKYQRNLGHSLRVVANKTEYEGYCHYPQHLDALKKLGVKIDFYDSLFKRSEKLNKSAIKALSNSIDKHTPYNLIHAHAAVPAKIAAESFSSCSQKPKIIQTMHGWGKNKSAEMEKQDVQTMNGLDKIVALNDTGKELMFKKGVDKSKIVNIPYGIGLIPPLPKFFNQEIESFLKEDWHLKFICIGEICDRKNQNFLLHALKDLELLGLKSCAVLIGPEQNDGYTKSLFKRKKVDHLARWTGLLQNACSYLHYFDALILPSKSEGMPLSILEGFREKVPFLGSNIPEFKDFIDHNKTGFLFSYDSTKEFINLVKSYEKKVWQDVAQNAHSKFLSNYNILKMGASYEVLYEHCINN